MHSKKLRIFSFLALKLVNHHLDMVPPVYRSISVQQGTTDKICPRMGSREAFKGEVFTVWDWWTIRWDLSGTIFRIYFLDFNWYTNIYLVFYHF